jgi:hypothetical protein
VEDEEVVAVEDPNKWEDHHDHEEQKVIFAVDDDHGVGQDLGGGFN